MTKESRCAEDGRSPLSEIRSTGAGNRSASYAVLEIGSLGEDGPLGCPRELALAFSDGSPIRAWLVLPEEHWALPGTKSEHHKLGARGSGFHPSQVAPQLMEAIGTLRVFAEHHRPTNKWLSEMLQAARSKAKIATRDFRNLVVPRGRAASELPQDRLRLAGVNAQWRYGGRTRAICDAAKHVQFANAVLTMWAELDRPRDDRILVPTRGGGPTGPPS